MTSESIYGHESEVYRGVERMAGDWSVPGLRSDPRWLRYDEAVVSGAIEDDASIRKDAVAVAQEFKLEALELFVPAERDGDALVENSEVEGMPGFLGYDVSISAPTFESVLLMSPRRRRDRLFRSRRRRELSRRNASGLYTNLEDAARIAADANRSRPGRNYVPIAVVEHRA